MAAYRELSADRELKAIVPAEAIGPVVVINEKFRNPKVLISVIGGWFQPENVGTGMKYDLERHVTHTPTSVTVEVKVTIHAGYGVIRELKLGILVTD